MSSDLFWPTTSRTIAYTLTNISYGNSMYIALTGTSTILYSLDNISWQVAFSANIKINKIVFLNNLFIAVGEPNNYTNTMAAVTSSNLIITSPDGINWTYRESPAIFRLISIAYGNNTFVIVGGTNKGTDNPNYVLTSTNGLTWTLRYGAADNVWRDIVYGNGQFVAVCDGGTWGYGTQGKTMISTDKGVNWTLKGVGSYMRDLYWHKIIYANGYFVSVSNGRQENSDGIMISPTGENYSWVTTTQFSGSLAWSTVTYDGRYVYITGSISGSSPKIYRSQITSTTPTWTQVMNIPQTPSGGTCFINYVNNQLFISGSSNYLAVNMLTPVLTNFNPSLNKYLGDSSFPLTAQSSNSTSLITYLSSNPAVATISGSTVNILKIGLVTITATQAANTNYIAAANTCSLIVIKSNPILSDFNYLTKIIGDSSFGLTPPTSNSTGTFSYSCSNPAVATISGSTVTIVGIGSATITATQAGSTDYEYGSASINCILTVIKKPPTLTGFNNLTKLLGDSFVLTPPISDSPGLFSYSCSDLSVLTISGSTVTTVGTGYAIITASHAETSYYASRNISCIINVTGKITTVLSNFDNITKSYSILPFNLTEPTTNSTGAFIYYSSNPSVASISGSTVTMGRTGSTIITATQSATSTHTSATSTLTLTITKITPILSGFTNLIKTFGDSSFSLSGVTSTSSGLLTFTCSNTDIATISGTTVNIIGGGTANIIATQLETGNFTSLKENVTLTVNKKEHVLSEFNSLTKTIGDSSFRLSPPVSTSNGAFSYSSSNTEVATISGNIVNMIAGGYTIITATQSATSDYASKTINCNLIVNKKSTVLSVFNNITKKIGDANFILNKPLSNRIGPFLYTSSNTEIASISGNIVTIIGVGSAIITATQGETSTHNSATINLSLIVNKKTTVLSGFNDIDMTVNDERTLFLVPPTSNGNDGSFSYTSSDEVVATIGGNMVEILKDGVTIIEAIQEETINYTLAKIQCVLSIIDNVKLDPDS